MMWLEGQNKNRYLMYYYMWRVMVGLHEEIKVFFLPVGHTKFSPDWCFGLLKRKYCKMRIGCLDDVVRAVHESGSPNVAQLVGDQNASALGIGAVLEQGGQVVAYTSRVLTIAEKLYSVIQQECVATVYALKQFHHYLLGRHFTLQTDHAPLQWLSSQKMEGMLCR